MKRSTRYLSIFACVAAAIALNSAFAEEKSPGTQPTATPGFMGNIYVDDKGQSVVHGHGSVALSDGSVKGGHWWEAHVSLVAVVFVTEEEAAP